MKYYGFKLRTFFGFIDTHPGDSTVCRSLWVGWIAAVLSSVGAAALAQRGAPTAVEAVALGETTIRVYWNGAPNAASYHIYRDGQVIGSTNSTDRQFDDKQAAAGKTYQYNVAAVDGAGAEQLGRQYVERAYDPILDREDPEVLVVGATTAGLSAAVTAARYGRKVVLIEETRRLGGMPANGLGATDMRRPEHSSGFFEEFRRKVQSIYGSGNGMSYEPRVAHQAIKEIVWGEKGLRMLREVRPVRVKSKNGLITEVEAEDLRSGKHILFKPKLVVDATECGDVAAWAGAPFRVGREPRSKREPHAGHLFYDRAGDKPLPGSTGKGDERVQAYAYLMTVQDFGPGADKTIPMPPGYDKSKYGHAPKFDTSWAVTSGKLPNNKFEVNQHPDGSDLQEVNYGYPTAGYAERRRIEKLYKDHALGYLYYIQTVEGKRNIGLSEDDYRDTDNWPPLLYIREARRFESNQVLDEYDISHSREVARPNAIGLGDYPMDSHAVQRKTDWSTPDMGEGEFYLPQYTPWHQAPYNVMIPRKLENVFVPTAVSATHVAYGTLRLEPVRMHFGEAAGVACHLCLQFGLTPRTVPVRQIQIELVKRDTPGPDRVASEGIGGPGPSAHPSYLYFATDVSPEMRKYRSIAWLQARGFYPSPEPKERTAASGQTAAPFKPDEPITIGEAERLLFILEKRRSASDGRAATRERLGGTSGSPAILTRGQAANRIAGFLKWSAKPGPAHYADVPPDSPFFNSAEAFYANWIDSRLWDPWPSYSPDGKLLFHPDQPITRAQFAEILFLAHFDIGPLFEDQPVDKGEIPIASP